MIGVVRASGLGVSSTSTAHTWPAYGLSGNGRPVDLRVRHVLAAPGRGPVGARSRRSECHHAFPSVQAGPSASHSRAASTARMCASRPSDGRRAG
jgi:hypothetical protein